MLQQAIWSDWSDLTKFYIKKDIQKLSGEENVKFYLISCINTNPNYVPIILELVENNPNLKEFITKISVLA